MVSVLLVLLLSAPPAAARARAEGPVGLVVLADTPGMAEDTHNSLMAEVHREVDRSRDFAWREPPPITLDELMLALSCDKADVACLMKTRDVLKTDAVALVSTPADGRHVQVAMVQFKPTRRVRKVEGTAAGPEELPTAAAAVLRGVLGAHKPSRLEVESSPAGAVVAMGDRVLGTTPMVLENAPEGRHELVLRLAGHSEARATVVVDPLAPARATVTLQPAPAAAKADPPPVAVTAAADPAPRPPAADRPPPPRATESPSPGPASERGGVPMVARFGLVGAGAVASAISLLGAVAGAGLLGGSGGVYALVWNVQAAQKVGNLLVYPLGAGGIVVAVLALVLLPVGAAMLGGGILLGIL